ncbi:uncharacterized protein LOC143109144 isoform X2 [Alosa pseudoharengus]|uniref:uncharacterized protein LOC143109144 isoform X2 n=1 Tax=Alosa pseudoharengus TaxID=34774 RepID=UPI003F8C521E
MPSRYEFSGIGSYIEGEWYNERSGNITKLNYKYPDCSLKITKLSDDHTGVYYFRFYGTLYRSWITSSSGVTLSVTDLQVKEDALQNQTKVICNTSCSLGSQYVWYKNERTLQNKTTNFILLDSSRPSEEGSYSCAVRGLYEAHRSPAVCVPKKQCWGVTYSSTSICALLGSSVDIPCTYKYPQDYRIKTAFWFNNYKSNVVEKYKNHVEYKGNNCTLRLKDIRESHSGEYSFGFTTEHGENYSGLPGVTISVTTLQVIMTPETVKEGKRVTLTCNTTCILTNPTFIWYKNGQPVTYKHTTRDNKLHLNPVSSEDAGN